MSGSPQVARSPEKVDVLLLGGLVLTLNDNREEFNPGALAVRGNYILAVGSRTEIEARYEAPDRPAPASHSRRQPRDQGAHEGDPSYEDQGDQAG